MRQSTTRLLSDDPSSKSICKAERVTAARATLMEENSSMALKVFPSTITIANIGIGSF